MIVNPSIAQEIWRENFSIEQKGIWGDEQGNVISDFTGVSWIVKYDSISLENLEDYAKTVSTSGGRFEVRDIDGEIVWYSEIIDISGFEKVDVRMEANETGSGTNTETKYLKAYYKINDAEEILFETNGTNSGNWGSALVEQKEIEGDSLQIIVRISNHYSADKAILDDVVVSAVEKDYPIPEPGDLILNEILFNPLPDGADYVEIYNLSEKEFLLRDLYLASRDNDLEIIQIYNLSGNKYLSTPGSYITFTKDTLGVFSFYSIQCRECFQRVAKMPSYNNDEDYVVLLNENLTILDEFHYNKNMHHPLLADEDGIALERISMLEETNQPGNWTSASSESGYGTPGYKNSQVETTNINKPEVTFQPEAFSPNDDGYNDEYQIHYVLNKSGFVATIKIFDSRGRFVRDLTNNEILSTSGQINWDGEDETGHKLPLGVYIVLVEIFHPDGEIYKYKDGVVLTNILE